MTLTEAFRHQAISCAALGSPFMGQLLNILAENWPSDSALAKKFEGFEGDIGPAGHSLPLRTAGGLHALVLSGQDEGLAQVYPPNTPTDAALRDAVLAAFETHAAFLLDWTDSPPQTNEVRRSAALIAGAHVAAQYFDLPIQLSELGASGGMNLMWDHYALAVGGAQFGPAAPALVLSPEWTGALPPARAPQIAERAGVDLNPLNPKRADHLLRLTAYLWPDQPHRLALTRAAAAVMDAPIDKGDAVEWLEGRLGAAAEGRLHLIQHSVAWQYFPDAVQHRGREMIEAAGAKATPDRPLGWLSMESDGDTTGGKGAAITLRLWPGDITLHLGRADFHGRWIAWHHPAEG
ncbi:DUF2332 domain-containing protein [Sulfitobacter donghicola]|uniref:DUF2332 domain-containing protein n=1 Tax=Sulfitobacter donghicola DSW-25 = KCTC 12864 = JCM 14565 TaxID=1300350 RepID=A0A073IET7_9RHOB|nr:DUF2332 family protein [Sulfitobacter donghicola]KEJ88030.1 hypothetical protein DSW25_17300 [Sulfitobacter donghicola DSW-25 = KCTC 12864 = JCM 14565]KIN68759.1 hypothetical protein Z948_2490 [Sulfitobacter donghicola DSW-25 = KCTC 12864 = JCM 14565]